MNMKFKKSLPIVDNATIDIIKAKYAHHLLKPGTALYPLEIALAIEKEVHPTVDIEKFVVDYELGLKETYYLCPYLSIVADPFNSSYYGHAYENWANKLVVKHKENLQKQEDESYVYYDAELGYFETEVNTNTKETKTMNYQSVYNLEGQDLANAILDMSPEEYKAFESWVSSQEKPSAPVLNTNKNIEVKPMSGAPKAKSIADAEAGQQAAQQVEAPAKPASKFDRSAAPMTAEEMTEAMMTEDNTVAAANGQEKSEEIAPVNTNTNTNSIPNNKTMDNTKPSNRKLVSIELVVNIIAAIGGDCARKSHSVDKRTEKLNVLRNKNSKTISNVRGYGAIRTNGNDGSCFLDVNVFPETAMTVYNTNNRPVIIFHYDDNTQVIQSEANTEKFWRKVLHASEEVVIPNINPTLKVDLPAGSDVLCERIDAGTIQAVSIKFTNMDKKMFSYYSTDVSGRFIVHLKAAGDYDVSLLRDTVEVSDNFLNYNGEKGAVNNFAGASKTGRSGNNAVVVARPQVAAAKAAAQANLFAMPVPAEVSKVVENAAPVAVVIDTEKETLRAENVALRAEVSELKAEVSEIKAMLAQLIAAQAVKTEEVSIPEINEVVAPAAPVEVVETEQEELARLEQERFLYFEGCKSSNFEENQSEDLDVDQYVELHAMDDKIAAIKLVINVPVADRPAVLAAEAARKAELAATLANIGSIFS